jgi:ribonucleoside-diphosphate reductase alpha chain
MMHGTGVGFSVERQFIHKLPEVPAEFIESVDTHIVLDSKLGWKLALDYCVDALFKGIIPKFDYSQVRPKGARLKTFGGRASGPEPLKQLFNFVIKMVKNAKGRKLHSIEVHDIATMTGECVVVGGVRRSACISFSNLSDQRLKHAKDGQFWLENPQRRMANNSIAYTEKPDSAIFLEEWLNLLRSGSGERGIFNTQAARVKADKFGRMKGDVRSNPCVEALLMDRQLCNLTEVVIRWDDTIEMLESKIEAAVLLGCVQSTMTNFYNVSPLWKENAEAERLIGVSLTGVCDSPLFKKVNEKTSKVLRRLRDFAHECAERFAKELGIVCPKQVTLVKPSGTVSQLCNCSSGLHTRHADYYIRRVRVTGKDPIALLLLSKGIPCNPEVGSTWEDYSTLVFDFPMKSPRGSLNRDDFTALEQLEYWKMFNDNFCDGNPSVTISVKEDEWVEVGAWVYSNWDSVCGLSFIPFDGGNYPLAPYETISKHEYYDQCKLYSKIEIDFDHELNTFEKEDGTTGAQTLACSGGQCEI